MRLGVIYDLKNITFINCFNPETEDLKTKSLIHFNNEYYANFSIDGLKVYLSKLENINIVQIDQGIKLDIFNLLIENCSFSTNIF